MLLYKFDVKFKQNDFYLPKSFFGLIGPFNESKKFSYIWIWDFVFLESLGTQGEFPSLSDEDKSIFSVKILIICYYLVNWIINSF